MRFSNLNVDGVAFDGHIANPGAAALFSDSVLRRASVHEGYKHPGRYDFVRTDLEPSDWTVVSMNSESVYRVQRHDGTAYRVNPDGTTSPIPAFAA